MNKLVWIVLIGILAASLALASGGKRMEEMRREIEQNVSYSKDREELLKGVGRYMDRRDAVLQRLAGLIKNESPDKQRDAWNDAAGSIQDTPELKVTLSTEEGIKEFRKLQEEEVRWIAKLLALPSASSRDQIVTLQANLKSQTERLRQEWTKQLGTDDAIDNQETQVMSELYTLLSKAIEDVTKGSENTRKAIQGTAGKAADSVPVVGGALSAIIEKLTEAKQSAQERQKKLAQLIDSEKGGLLVLFRENRPATDKFIQENGFDQIKALYAKAQDDLKEFASFGTSAQQADAKSWAEDISASLGKHVATAQDIFNTFAKENQGKFFGPISPEISELLLETRTWDDQRGRFEKLDLEGKLREWRDAENGFFEISSSGLSDEEKEFLKKNLESDLQKLIRATEDFSGVIAEDTFFQLFDRRILGDLLK
ncbi:MAG TPA: hypothetical protein VFS50_05735 [Meiothermus sp.]|nr:hypothetical protein [Meiothermus sp.]